MKEVLPSWWGTAAEGVRNAVGANWALILVSLAFMVFLFVKCWKNIKGAWEVFSDFWEQYKPLPKAPKGKYTVILSRIDGDTKNELYENVLATLREFDEVEVIALTRVLKRDTSGIQSIANTRSYANAQAMLKKSGAHLHIWGHVLRNGNTAVPYLHLTPSAHTKTNAFREGKYPLSKEDLSLFLNCSETICVQC